LESLEILVKLDSTCEPCKSTDMRLKTLLKDKHNKRTPLALVHSSMSFQSLNSRRHARCCACVHAS